MAAKKRGPKPGRARARVVGKGSRVRRRSLCLSDETLNVVLELSRRLRVSRSVVMRSALRLVGQATDVHNDPVLERVAKSTLRSIRGAFNAALVSEVSPGEAVRAALPMFSVPTKKGKP